MLAIQRRANHSMIASHSAVKALLDKQVISLQSKRNRNLMMTKESAQRLLTTMEQFLKDYPLTPIEERAYIKLINTAMFNEPTFERANLSIHDKFKLTKQTLPEIALFENITGSHTQAVTDLIDEMIHTGDELYGFQFDELVHLMVRLPHEKFLLVFCDNYDEFKAIKSEAQILQLYKMLQDEHYMAQYGEHLLKYSKDFTFSLHNYAEILETFSIFHQVNPLHDEEQFIKKLIEGVVITKANVKLLKRCIHRLQGFPDLHQFKLRIQDFEEREDDVCQETDQAQPSFSPDYIVTASGYKSKYMPEGDPTMRSKPKRDEEITFIQKIFQETPEAIAQLMEFPPYGQVLTLVKFPHNLQQIRFITNTFTQVIQNSTKLLTPQEQVEILLKTEYFAPFWNMLFTLFARHQQVYIQNGFPRQVELFEVLAFSSTRVQTRLIRDFMTGFENKFATFSDQELIKILNCLKVLRFKAESIFTSVFTKLKDTEYHNEVIALALEVGVTKFAEHAKPGKHALRLVHGILAHGLESSVSPDLLKQLLLDVDFLSIAFQVTQIKKILEMPNEQPLIGVASTWEVQIRDLLKKHFKKVVIQAQVNSEIISVYMPEDKKGIMVVNKSYYMHDHSLSTIGLMQMRILKQFTGLKIVFISKSSMVGLTEVQLEKTLLNILN